MFLGGDGECYIVHFNIIGVNISERKSGTERTKKREKWELVFFLPLGGATDKTTGKTHTILQTDT